MSAVGYGLAVSQAFMDSLMSRVKSLETNKADVQTVNAIETEISTPSPMRGQSERIQVVGSAGLATWVYPTAFDVNPSIQATAETPAVATFTNVASVVQGSISKTQVQIAVVQIPKSITLPTLATALLGLVISLFGVAPAGVYVQVYARKP
ncbi:hypothetical protein ASG25_10545 [Rhizobium sp. Leaf384]|uniref:hypothetical protein n=1 Tax=Rhizobium sp. Leaf384 TaxID=1736358 RepID=UPI000712FCBF|nr:hypothetical protein [Rhizobium sp. Leaf384]KQS79019.1 hypothetical protein ASG25_10545 [Rhizobium sp. Leaf384]